MRGFTRRVGLGRLTGDAGAVALGHLSAFIYPIVSIPFLSRLLGSHDLGRLIFAMAIIQVVIYVVDFGFGMSALRAVSVARSATERANIVGATICAKLLLLAACSVLLVPLIFLIPQLRADWPLYLIGVALVIGEAVFPSWLLQGLGRMKTFAVLTAVSRLLALVGLLLTVRSASDTALAMFWQFAPMVIAATLCWLHLRRLGLAQIHRPSLVLVRNTLRESSPLFVSSLATMVIGAANAVALGALSSMQQVAYFGTAERMSNAARGVLSGVQEAMLPRMTATETDDSHDDSALRRTIMVALAGCYVVAGLTMIGTAHWLIPWYLGAGFDDAVPVARWLGVALCITGFAATFTLVLVARNEFGTLSRVMALSAVIHLVILPIGCAMFGGIGAAGAVVGTETCLAVMLAVAYRRSRRRPVARPSGAGAVTLKEEQ
ncbi:oligosaccharide flippase family protein [Saxibacter everestensis]|uniref:Oligosaccharide flippase family protein n=1 Tax=Saxibacter everestensis TaxID=2909229 RepID=A0ABY8QSA8_9MICO|nr:oligosaccharide flippase family protein [Brevibacteriaceae bacterium ZFBP1038]